MCPGRGGGRARDPRVVPPFQHEPHGGAGLFVRVAEPVRGRGVEVDRVARPEGVGLETHLHLEATAGDDPYSRPPWRTMSSGGQEALPGAYSTWRKSASGSSAVRRSHTTPDIWTRRRSPARTTGSSMRGHLPAPAAWAAAGPSGASVVLAAPAGSAAPESSSFKEMPSTDTRAYRVPTEGLAFPSSTCEMKLGETSTWRATSRSESPREPRAARRAAPRFSARDSGVGALASVIGALSLASGVQ